MYASISITYENQQYDFNFNDIDLALNSKPFREGAFGEIYEIKQKCQGSQADFKKFIIKITEIPVENTQGCNNALEIKLLEELARINPDLSPYLIHITINDFYERNIHKFVTFMKHYDYDLYELIIFFTDISNFEEILEKTKRFINLKKAFYDKFLKNGKDKADKLNLIHESIISLIILQIMTTLYQG